MKVKTLARLEWARILEREQSFMPLKFEKLNGYAGLLSMKHVTAPLAVPVLNEQLIIADDGFSWLQIAPENENWWLTVMFDRGGEIIQYYFDLSLKNEIDGENSWFTDLYLDVVLLPDGRVALLDEDELDAALGEGTITALEYALAVRTAKMLMQSVGLNQHSLRAFCERIRNELLGLMKS